MSLNADLYSACQSSETCLDLADNISRELAHCMGFLSAGTWPSTRLGLQDDCYWHCLPSTSTKPVGMVTFTCPFLNLLQEHPGAGDEMPVLSHRCLPINSVNALPWQSPRKEEREHVLRNVLL